MVVYSEEFARVLRGHLQEERPGEIAFLLDYAAIVFGPILELACGAGRVMRELAAAGHRVYGIDASLAMLNMAEQTTKDLDEKIRDRMCWMQGDMRTFDTATIVGWPKRFGMIIIPFNSFWYNLDQDEAQQCVERILAHLDSRGIFLIEGPDLVGQKINQPDRVRERIAEWWDSEGERLGFAYIMQDYLVRTDWYRDKPWERRSSMLIGCHR